MEMGADSEAVSILLEGFGVHNIAIKVIDFAGNSEIREMNFTVEMPTDEGTTDEGTTDEGTTEEESGALKLGAEQVALIAGFGSAVAILIFFASRRRKGLDED